VNLLKSVEQYGNLANYIEQSTLKYQNQPVYTCLEQTLTFKDVDEKSYALACYFKQVLKLKQGDRIVIQLPNLIQYPIAIYAALRAGLVIVNTNPLYTTREMLHQFNDAGAKAIVILKDLLPKVNDIQADTPIKHVIVTDATDLITNAISTPLPNAAQGHVCFNQCILDGQGLTLEPISSQLDDLAVIQYTGGTTGLSKGAILTHSNLLSNVLQTAERLSGVSDVDEGLFVTPLPFYHIYAFLLNLWLFGQGYKNVLIPNPRDMDGFITTIAKHQPTGFCGINTLFLGLCNHPKINTLDFSRLKFTVSGGAALTTAASNSWQEVTGCTISEGYGLSETSPVVTLNPPSKEQIGSIGLPVINTEIQIWNDDEQEVALGEAGELVVRGPQVMKGYWQQVEETNKVLTKEGWFKTGDVAVAQDDGYFRIVDRKKDMIIVSGFNVYPNEIEDILASHPDIIEAAVIGEPNDKTGELVSAYIVKVPNAVISEQDIVNYCRELLTPYKIPKKINFLAELPKSSVGKILRKDLRSN
jgi:long-chain acyl-CoA synthetase